MVVVSLRLVAPAGKRSQVLQALRSLIGPTRVTPGCIRCDLYLQADNSDVIRWVEEWESQAHLDRRLRSADYRTILAVMDMSAEPPDVHFDDVSAREGFERVIAARHGSS